MHMNKRILMLVIIIQGLSFSNYVKAELGANLNAKTSIINCPKSLQAIADQTKKDKQVLLGWPYGTEDQRIEIARRTESVYKNCMSKLVWQDGRYTQDEEELVLLFNEVQTLLQPSMSLSWENHDSAQSDSKYYTNYSIDNDVDNINQGDIDCSDPEQFRAHHSYCD